MERLAARVLLSLPTLWTAQGPGGGGSYFSAAVNGNDLWVASDMSGIYHSANFGATWQMQNFHAINGGTASKITFTSDANVLYIPNSSLGVAKSSDGGATWSKLGNFPSTTAYWMAADPTSSSKILVASTSNLYLSSNGGSSFTTAYSSSGLFVAGALFDGSNVYVGTNKGLLISTNGGSSFALSTATGIASGQYMTSFTGAKVGTTTRLLAITSATNPNAANTNGTSARAYAFGKLYRLDVGGSWIDKTSTIPSGQKMHFAQMARNDINTAYLAGSDANGYGQVYKSTNGGDSWSDVFLTTGADGGGVPNKNIYTGYEGSSGDFDYSWGGDPWSFAVSSSDANRLMSVDFGFIHVSSDGGASWHQAYVNPADENSAGAVTPTHRPYHTAGSDDTSVHYLTWIGQSTIVAGYTDTIGWRSTDGGSSWSFPSWYTTGGNGDNNTVYKTELSPDGTKLYGATSTIHDIYQSNYLLDTSISRSYQNGRVVVSNDQGATWSLIHEFGHPVVWEQLDPNIANRMYAMVVDGPASSDAGAAGGIWMTDNLSAGASSTWTHLPSPSRTQGHPYILRILNDGTLVATFSGRRFNDGTGEKFTDSSGVFVGTWSNGTLSWTDRSAANMHWYTKEIAIDPTDPTQSTWYVGVDNGWSGTGNDLGDLYRTTNRGVSWTKMGLNNLVGRISLDINSVTINSATKEMYVATGIDGVLYAPDVTVANFSSANFSDVTSFPFAWIERVFINPNDPKDVWVATFGGGIKRGGVAPTALAASVVSDQQINLSWTENSANEAGFEIDRATDSAFTQNLVTTTAGANVTSTSIYGLTAGTTYYFRVRAVSGMSKSANSAAINATPVVVANPVFQGSGGVDNFYVRRNGTSVEVFNTPTAIGAPIFSGTYANIASLTFSTSGGDDGLVVDGGGGNPIPPSGISLNPGTGANTITISGGSASGTINLSGGAVALAAANSAGADVTLAVNSGGTLSMNSSLQLAGLNLAGGNATVSGGSATTVKINNLQIASPWKLDLASSAAVLHASGGYASIAAMIQSGRNGGAWNGSGIITSMSDARLPKRLTTIGVAQASALLGISSGQTAMWYGQTADATAALVRYTYGGDANLDGVINGDDYFRIDAGYSAHGSGFLSGDFDYNGRIDADDYMVIDSNYNKGGTALVASPSALGVQPAALTEPANSTPLYQRLIEDASSDLLR